MKIAQLQLFKMDMVNYTSPANVYIAVVNYIFSQKIILKYNLRN